MTDSTQWMPSTELRLDVSGCAGGGSTWAPTVGVLTDLGGFVSTAYSEASSNPYPAAGQHFTLALAEPSYIGFDSAAVASCEKLEARDSAGQSLWQWEPGVTLFGDIPVVTDTKGFTSRLQGTVDFGIWGNGCNATEAKAGFRVTQVLSEESLQSGPPVTMTLPGQKLRHDGTVDNWYRYYEPELGRYLSPEPLMQSPSTIRMLAGEGRRMAAYAYASNSPIMNVDSDGNLDSQAKRNGKPNETVRQLEQPLRKELSARCAREYEENRKKCLEKANKCDPVPLPASPSRPDAKAADEQRTRQMQQQQEDCEKGTRCEYEACLAGANSGVNTTDYMRQWTECMRK
jgi:RHS repeat-associated protein